MSQYKRIIAAIDLSDESDAVLKRACEVAQQNSAELSLVHVVEIISYAYGGEMPVDIADIQTQVENHAERRIKEIADKLDYPITQKLVATGNTGSEIHSVAQQLDADLIVIGSHGRHGISLLLGSTANGVLHGANCDILAVRLGA
ncbi:universal stress protein [Marinobacterium sp. LSUCC0821]|jgi:universal stress protein A|uniref:universal stress protein n=1 Tax=Marinobacterium sp. LSUCC0821 TaxID=2668067 RepID=UPI001451C996|nr:universal stress protein [Marinobacterium sp. LSUCC0821]QJD70981.1 universal stress protein [Marinobacterium sp. LSUCC0821]